MTDGSPELESAILRKRVGPAIPLILRRAVALGFLGGMAIDDQIDHALGFVSCVETVLGRPPASAVDLGSGGGVPGLILASCWPDCQLVLLDSNERRTAFLASEVVGIVADNVEVIRGRAEEMGREERWRSTFEVVTARSFGPPSVTSECGAPLLMHDGLLVVSEPPEQQSDSRWPVDGLALLGLALGPAVKFDGRFGFQTLTKVEPTPERYPRRVGIPTKRPLF